VAVCFHRTERMQEDEGRWAGEVGWNCRHNGRRKRRRDTIAPAADRASSDWDGGPPLRVAGEPRKADRGKIVMPSVPARDCCQWPG
jgi:hypothetical protein